MLGAAWIEPVLATWLIRQLFFGFYAEISSADFSFSLKVGLVYFLNTHWDYLDDRFLENTPITSNKIRFDFIS
jgi:hypothetical protein